MLMNKQVYMYDCFGTILLGKKEHPRSWNKRIASFLDLDDYYVSQLRRQSEITVASRSVIGEYRFDEMLVNFWQRYLMGAGFQSSICCSDFFNFAVQTEVEDIQNSTELNMKLFAEILLLRKKERQVIMLSDFYLGKTEISRIIESKINNLESAGGAKLFDEIFVSCEIGANKSSGSAYSYILGYYGLKPSVFLMTGDNIRSDYFNALVKGIGGRICRDEKKNTQSAKKH